MARWLVECSAPDCGGALYDAPTAEKALDKARRNEFAHSPFESHPEAWHFTVKPWTVDSKRTSG